MSTREVFIHANGDLLAAAAAARLATCTADALAADGGSHLVLTGGGIGTKVLAAVAASPALDAVDWRSVDFWWGDERFAPEGDPDRNETGARAALFDHIPVDSARVHSMPGPDGPDGDDVDAAASRYAAELADVAAASPAAPGGVAVPIFDVLMLGIGPEGHIASIFPESPRRVCRRDGRRGTELPQAAADADLADVPGHPGRARGVDPGLRRGEGGGGRAGAGRRARGQAPGRRRAGHPANPFLIDEAAASKLS